MKIQWYQKTKIFRRGLCLNIALLYPCNLSCPYCSLEMPTGIRPKGKVFRLEDWKRIIPQFPAKIREVFISGGEPTMLKWMPELVNWLLDEGYHVTILTNLHDPSLLLTVKQSYRLQIRASFHLGGGDNAERFDKAYKLLKPHYNLNVDEIVGEYKDRSGTIRTQPKSLPYSISKPFATMDVLKTTEDFRYSPDGHLYTSCYDRYEAG